MTNDKRRKIAKKILTNESPCRVCPAGYSSLSTEVTAEEFCHWLFPELREQQRPSLKGCCGPCPCVAAQDGPPWTRKNFPFTRKEVLERVEAFAYS